MNRNPHPFGDVNNNVSSKPQPSKVAGAKSTCVERAANPGKNRSHAKAGKSKRELMNRIKGLEDLVSVKNKIIQDQAIDAVQKDHIQKLYDDAMVKINLLEHEKTELIARNGASQSSGWKIKFNTEQELRFEAEDKCDKLEKENAALRRKIAELERPAEKDQEKVDNDEPARKKRGFWKR